MEKYGSSFVISDQFLTFTSEKTIMNAMVKNTALRSTSFSLHCQDNQHFQIISNRQFSLAPGMSRSVQFKHIDSSICSDASRQKRVTIVNSSLGHSDTISCICPHYIVKQQHDLVQFPQIIDLNEFDRETSTSFVIKNKSDDNLRIVLDSQQSNGVTYSFVSESCVVLTNEKLEIEVKVRAEKSRTINQNVQFQLYSQNDYALKSHGKTQQQRYRIKFIGNCTNKSIIVRNEDKEPISELKLSCLNGASTNHHFFIDSSYHKQMEYSISASVVAESPIEFAYKSRMHSIKFAQGSGILPAENFHKISLKTESQLTDDDQNYIKKYSKISISDEKSAINLQNGTYSKKYIEFIIKITYQINNKQQVIKLPIQCCFINPSIRIQTISTEQVNYMKTEIVNDTDVNIPYHVNLHSLYRIDKHKGEFKKREKTGLNLKWAKNNERCSIDIQIPGIRLPLFCASQCKPSSRRRPMTSQKLVCNLTKSKSSLACSYIDSQHAFTAGFRPFSAKYQVKCLKTPRILNQVTHKARQAIIPQQQLDCIKVHSRVITNHHSHLAAVLEIIPTGFIVLKPGQTYNFNEHTNDSISYKIRGHEMIFKIPPNRQQTRPIFKQNAALSTINFSKQLGQQPYKFLTKELFMSFKQSKQQFQVIDCFLIQNNSDQSLLVHCLTVNGEFFECKQSNNCLKIPAYEVGKFKIGFMPKNAVPANFDLAKSQKENHKKAIFDTSSGNNCMQISKQMKFLINGTIEMVKCRGEAVLKKCEVKPQFIDFSQLSYGSMQTSQNLSITSCHQQFSFVIDHPPEVNIKPTNGVVPCKGTITCSVSFHPSQKISIYSKQIRIYIGGSHMEIVPLHIGFQNPQIYIKEDELIIKQYAICGPVNQELNTHITVVNNTTSQSFVQIDLYETGLVLGYSENRHLSYEMQEIQTRLLKYAKIVTNQSCKAGAKGTDYPLLATKSIKQQFCEQILQFIVTVMPEDSLQIPLTYKTSSIKQGHNLIPINNNIAQLVGFGAIKCPSLISYDCKRTLLHISPYKQRHEIAMTKNQQNYKITLKNVTNNKIKIRTHIYQQKLINDTKVIVCAFKDIDQCFAPGDKSQLNITFIVSDRRTQMKPEIYKLDIYLTDKIDDDYSSEPYYTTNLNVRIAQPTLLINPKRVILPTVRLGAQSQGSFTINNQGHKQIFIKINRPLQIAFDFQFEISKIDSNKSEKNKDLFPRNTQRNKWKQLNRLTTTQSCVLVRLFAKNNKTLSFSMPLEIEDNFGNKQEVIVSGTFTDCPLFALSNVFSSAESLNCLVNSERFISCKSITQASDITVKNRNQSDFIDIRDVRFLNNWFSRIIPDFSTQGLSFEVWLTKRENLLKFFREFGVKLQNKQFHNRVTNSSLRSSHRTLINIFEQLKKQGFLLNSLRIDILEKADQSEWLNFIWFFFSRQIISPQFEQWASKLIGQTISYETLFKSYEIHVPRLIKQKLGLKKESISADWPQLIERFEPLLSIFNNVQSKRQLILSVNLLFQRLTNLKREKVEISGQQMNLFVENKQMRTLKYFLFCDIKYLSCSQPSKDTGRTSLTSKQKTTDEFSGGYTFSVGQGETNELKLGLKKMHMNKMKSDFDLVLCSNDMWDPITMYKINFKAKEKVKHTVTIECEQKCTRDWVLDFSSKMSAEYQFTFQGHSSLKMASSSLGYLKKGQTATIRVTYTPMNIDKHQATLTISNSQTEEIYSIQGKPLHSSKIQFETYIKTTINKQVKHSFTIPWQIKSSSISLSTTNFQIKFVNQQRSDIKKLTAQFKSLQQQMQVYFTSQFLQLYRGLQILLRIHNESQTQSKIIKLIVYVAPKPIYIRAEIETQLNHSIIENITIHNLYKIGQTVQIHFQPIQNEAQITKEQPLTKLYDNSVSCPFEVIGVRNNDKLSFVHKVGEILDELQVRLKFHPNITHQGDKLMYCLSLAYSESLAKVHYIFVGKIKQSIYKQISEQERSICYECTPLQKYQKTLTIHNSKPIAITFEVSTEMNEISGDPTITVNAQSSAIYNYQILCLHLGDKNGSLLFQGEYKGQKIEQRYNLHLKLSSYSACQGGIKIYQQKYNVESKVRKQKTLSILLNNLSKNNLEYQIMCNSPYLQAAPTIQLKQHSQTTLDIEYIPLFVGEQTALLTLYNPHQPEITYSITMISHEHIQQISEQMPQIGETKPIKISFNNPSQRVARISLQSVIFNSFCLEKWSEHLKFFYENGQHLQSPSFTIQPHQTINLQLHFKSIKLQQSYKYLLTFSSEQLSLYKFNILYRYPTQKLMKPIFLHSSSISSIQFLNRFENTQKFHCKFDSKSISLIDIRNTKNCNKHWQFELEELTTAWIEFEVMAKGEEIRICVQSNDNKFTWIYPITVYELCVSDVKTVTIEGQANQRISVKVFPVCITSLSNVQLVASGHDKVAVSLSIVRNSIRLRRNTDGPADYHHALDETKVYQVELQALSATPCKSSGFLYLYSSQRKAIVSASIIGQQLYQMQKNLSQQLIVEKIPYELMISQAKARTVQISAKIGEKSVVKVKIESIAVTQSKVKQKSLTKQRKLSLELLNNKNKQFDAKIDQNSEYLELSYHPKHYSGVKKAKLNLKIDDCYYRFQLIGAYLQK